MTRATTATFLAAVAIFATATSLASADDTGNGLGDPTAPVRILAGSPTASIPLVAFAVGQTGSDVAREPPEVDRITWHTAELAQAVRYFEGELDSATRPANRKFAESTLTRLRSVQRPAKVRLTLQDALHRTLANSLLIRVQSYAPAIFTASLVEAEAAFDATYFMNMTKNVIDRPSASQLSASKFDLFTLTGGIRKTLPNGMQVTTSLNIQRQFIGVQFQLLNPEFTSAFVAEFTQPLLRNGGIDFNRSRIEISRNDQRIGQQAFKRQARDSLFATEQFYWQLVQARREVVINARLLAEFEKIYDYLWQRRDFDTYQIQLSQTKANLEAQKADFIRIVNNVRDAEDALVASMNDPVIDLATDIEIVPVDFPTTHAIPSDPAAEVQIALDNRSELRERYLRIDSAKLRVGQAKNQALPRLDLTFRYTVDGLGSNFDDAFDQLTQSDFMEYLVVLDLEMPMGNRAGRAALRRARLQHAQEAAGLKNQIEQVILEVNRAVRDVNTTFDQIEPSLQSANANEDQVRSVIARAERKDFNTLNQELSARNALGASRSNLLAALVQYNIAIIELERAKGTLLEYNNVTLVGEED